MPSGHASTKATSPAIGGLMSVRPLNACRKVVNHKASNLASCGIGLVPLFGRDLRKSNSLFVKRLPAVVHFMVCSTFPMKDCISCLDITYGRLAVGVTLDVDELVCVSGTAWREDEGPVIAINSGGLLSPLPAVEWLGPAIAIGLSALWPPVTNVAGLAGA